PSRDVATLSFETNQTQHAIVKITDAAGRLIEANNLGVLSVGKYNYQLKGDRLPAGVYHVTLESGLGITKTLSWMITK
ncbi:MAG: FlgD immunoglobulin-like domain containing protein, partial [Bacteroidia bacterium]